MPPHELGQIRRSTRADWAEIEALLRGSLGIGDDDRYEKFLRWKHQENPFGESPSWVLVDGGDIVGVRIFLRWEFTVDGGSTAVAVRAVDTATAPSHRGRGVFTRLTLAALEDLAPEVDFVYNTPNDQSRPGYMKMGWVVVGRLPARFRPRPSVRALGRLGTARKPADRWSMQTPTGRAASEALNEDGVDDLLCPATNMGLATRRSSSFIRWRYGLDDLRYRTVQSQDADGGIAIYRLRRRGSAIEATICELFAPGPDERSKLIRLVLHTSAADYALYLASNEVSRAVSVPVPGGGPILTWRDLCWAEMPPLEHWRLSLGDVELF